VVELGEIFPHVRIDGDGYGARSQLVTFSSPALDAPVDFDILKMALQVLFGVSDATVHVLAVRIQDVVIPVNDGVDAG